MNLEQLHNEKLEAHSRENEKPDICCECDNEPDECGCNPETCQENADIEASENNFEGAREAHD